MPTEERTLEACVFASDYATLADDWNAGFVEGLKKEGFKIIQWPEGQIAPKGSITPPISHPDFPARWTGPCIIVREAYEVLSSERRMGPWRVIAVDGEHAYWVYTHWRRERAKEIRDALREKFGPLGIRFHCARADRERWQRRQAELMLLLAPPEAEKFKETPVAYDCGHWHDTFDEAQQCPLWKSNPTPRP